MQQENPSGSGEQYCSQFNQIWATGGEPDFGDYARRLPPGDRELFRRLLLIELHHRKLREQMVSPESYANAFPDLADEVHRAFQSHQNDATILQYGSSSPPVQAPRAESDMPSQSGRFEVLRILGAGAFGTVNLAYDPTLQRLVAIKTLSSGGPPRDRLLAEARNLAALSHPNIVTIHEVSAESDEPYIVQEYLEGGSLSERLRAGDYFSVKQSIQLMLRIAEAVQTAHDHDIFHRDLKPGNILFHKDGTPKLIDFGLAIHESDLIRKPAEIAGSLRYMAPEQYRGETHRICKQTDQWGLCVLLYRLLTGQLPFDDPDADEIGEQILYHFPTPPQQIDSTIPRSLELIVMKGLSKRISDRFGSCAELIEALTPFASDDQAALPTSVTPTKIAITPRGLAPFGLADSEAWVSLLPGPYELDGTPSSVQFWLDRIRTRAIENPVPVGLIYGGSGAGKTSLIRAGLMPRVGSDVLAIYQSCDADNIEVALADKLRQRCEGCSQGRLPSLFAELRENESLRSRRKVVIFLDQFEQWLSGRTAVATTALVQALRHCDGTRLQVILAIRDDFWLSTTQLFDALEIPISDQHNARVWSSPPKRHAREVLWRFGIGYGSFPAGETTTEQSKFLDQAIDAIAVESEVPCVALALFAHVFRTEQWTAERLNQFGGAAGVGWAYVSRLLDDKNFKLDAIAIRNVLNALLPSFGGLIKGRSCSRTSLGAACGLSGNKLTTFLKDMAEQTGLITVTEGSESASEPQYRLAHDYLVEPVRQWVQLSERRTLRGRAAADLRQSAAWWSQERRSELVPSFPDFVRMSLLAPKKDRGTNEWEYLAAAEQHFKPRLILAAVLAIALAIGAVWETRRRENIAKVEEVIDALVEADTESDFDGFTEELKTLGGLGAIAELIDDEDIRTRVRARIVASSLPRRVDALLDSEGFEGPRLIRILQSQPSLATEQLSERLNTENRTNTLSSDHKARLGAASVILGKPELANRLVRPDEDPLTRTLMVEYMAAWVEDWKAQLRFAEPNPAVRALVRSAIVDSITLAWASILESDEEYLAYNIDLVCRDLLPFTDVTDDLLTDAHSPTVIGSLATLYSKTSDRGFARMPGAGDNWLLRPEGVLFLRLSRPNASDLFVSRTEISYRQLRLMFPNGEFDRARLDIASRGNNPVQDCSLHQVARICNALSERDGLTPCFSFGPNDVLSVDTRQDGYRLLTATEYEALMKGHFRQARRWHFSSSLRHDGFFERYEVATGFVNGFVPPGPVGSRLPNSFGFSDTIGNAMEWTCSPSHERPLPSPAGPVDRPAGEYLSFGSALPKTIGASQIEDSYFSSCRPEKWELMTGFRLARIAPSPSPKDDRASASPKLGPAKRTSDSSDGHVDAGKRSAAP